MHLKAPIRIHTHTCAQTSNPKHGNTVCLDWICRHYITHPHWPAYHNQSNMPLLSRMIITPPWKQCWLPFSTDNPRGYGPQWFQSLCPTIQKHCFLFFVVWLKTHILRKGFGFFLMEEEPRLNKRQLRLDGEGGVGNNKNVFIFKKYINYWNAFIAQSTSKMLNWAHFCRTAPTMSVHTV